MELESESQRIEKFTQQNQQMSEVLRETSKALTRAISYNPMMNSSVEVQQKPTDRLQSHKSQLLIRRAGLSQVLRDDSLHTRGAKNYGKSPITNKSPGQKDYQDS